MKNIKDKEIINTYLMGVSGHNIARRLGISPTQVYYVLRRAEVPRRERAESQAKWWKAATGNDYAAKSREALELLGQGLSGKAVAAQLGVCQSTVSKWKKQGVGA